MTRLLLVTADDFGLTEGVNRAVLRAHRDGIVTSASVLAVGRAYEDAVRMAKAAPDLAVGVHLAAVGEDPPLLPATSVPSLVDAAGHFPLAYPAVLRRAMLGRLEVDDLRREFRAQIERVVGDGLAVTHLDTHQHLHLWPSIGAVVVELAHEFGIPGVRLPRSHRRGPVGLGVSALAALLHRRLESAGLTQTGDFAGLDEAGALHRRLGYAVSGLARRGSRTAELNAHPGEDADPDLARFSWGYRWGGELAVLTDPASRALITDHGFELASWRQLATTKDDLP